MAIYNIRFIVILIFTLLIPIEIHSQMKTVEVKLEVITSDALAGGDGGNQWGGHQCRIVRTVDGIFTVYTSGDKDHFERKWHLMKRTANGWVEIAVDKSGREPVNLMTGPRGKLHIIGWADYHGTMWSGKPSPEGIKLAKEQIPVVYSGSHPYNAAGIDMDGNICVITSVDDNDEGGRFLWAYYNAESQQWQGRVTFLNFRYCLANIRLPCHPA